LVVFDTARISDFAPAIGAFVLICSFDIFGVMFGLATLGNIVHPTTGEIPGSLWAFIASSVVTMIAARTGSTPIIVCVECAFGIREGGRTGLTAIVIGLYFLLSVFVAPFFSAVPEYATAPILVMVGVMMMGESAKIPRENMNDALLALLTIILMPLTYSITNGIIFGLVTSATFYFTTGQFMFVDAKQLHRNLSTASVPNETEALVTANSSRSDSDGKANGVQVAVYGTV
jgi:adenine/guanine/hypoxanthine permease